ncbi:reverse transcriptase domain-containing protein, partial [Tanacetum coccineum]
SSELPPSISPSEPPKRNPHQPPILYPSRLNKEKLQDKSNIQVHKFLQMFKKLHFNISLADALALMPESVAYPASIAEDVCVQVGKFTFPADFVVVDYDVDPRVPLILGRPFLRTARALVDVYGEELILRDGDEKLIFHADSTSKHPHKHGNESINMINFIDITCEDRFQEVLKIKKSNHPFSGSTTSPSDSSPSLTPFETSDSLLEEFADELALLDPFPPGNEDDNFDPEADLREIKYLLNRDPSTDSSPTTDIDIIDPILERFTDEPALVYSSPLEDDDDDLFDFKSDNEEWKKLFDSTLPEESSEIATLLSSPFGNEDKVFNPGILILGGTHIFNDESKDKDLKVNTSSEAFLILEERFPMIVKTTVLVFNPPITRSPIIFIFDPFVEIPSDESKVHIEVLSVLWGNRLPIPDGSLPLSSGKQLGATCSTEVDPSVTHVISIDAGTEKSRWAVKGKKFLVEPRWLEAANFLWQRQTEEMFPVVVKEVKEIMRCKMQN